jgi:hypothetical protein
MASRGGYSVSFVVRYVASMYVVSWVVEGWAVLRWRFIYAKRVEFGGGMCGVIIGIHEGCASVVACAERVAGI